MLLFMPNTVQTDKMTRHITQIIFLLMMAVITTSCVSEESFDNTPEGNFEALWKVIDEHYCFLDYKKQTLGTDWDRVHVLYRQRLNSKMNNEQLFEVLAELLAELRDGHVNLYAAHDVGRNWSWYEDYPTNFYEDLQDAYLGTDYRIASGLKYRILPDNVGYMVCNSFQNSIGEGNLSEVMHYLRTCTGMIIDIRDNGGGDLTTAEKLAARFTNEKVLTGYIQHKTGRGRNDFSSPEAQYLEPADGVRWQKPVVVLTNRRCYSAANTFVRDMRCCPQVTIVGDQTGGGSGLPFSSELPNGWSVRFSACPMLDAQMQQIEFGIAPDVQVSLTDDDRARGRDTLIEAARTMLNNRK